MDTAMLDEYLERIGLDAFPAMDIAGIDQLKQAHSQAIAFENLDVRLSRPIHIDSENVFDKLVRRRRGGYCFEHNRLFSDVLTALGVSHRPLLARGLLKLPPDEISPRNHVCLLAQVGGEHWLIDAGSGALHISPLPLKDGATSASGHRLSRVGEMGSLSGEWLLEYTRSLSGNNGAMRQYCFDLAEVSQVDLEQANHWTSTRAGSLFVTRNVLSIALKDGFVSLSERELRIYRQSGKHEQLLESPAVYAQCLRETFKLNVSDEEAASLPIFNAA